MRTSDKGSLQKEEFVGTYSSRGRIHNGWEATAAGSRSRKLREHIFDHKQTEKAQEVG